MNNRVSEKPVSPAPEESTDANPAPPSQAAVERRYSFDVDHEHLRKQRVFVNATDKESRIALSSYKSLRTHMLREMEKRSVRSLVVTGPTVGVGKSVTAANLAINIARHQKKRVLLVDLDLRSPSIAGLFGIEPRIGIDSILDKRVSFPQAIVYPDILHLSLLPCVERHEDSAEILLTDRMQALLKILRNYKEDYIVIFDAPPILGCDDVAAIASIIDLCLVVVGEGETSRRELRHAMQILGDIPVAAVLLNKSSQDFFKRYYY